MSFTPLLSLNLVPLILQPFSAARLLATPSPTWTCGWESLCFQAAPRRANERAPSLCGRMEPHAVPRPRPKNNLEQMLRAAQPQPWHCFMESSIRRATGRNADLRERSSGFTIRTEEQAVEASSALAKDLQVRWQRPLLAKVLSRHRSPVPLPASDTRQTSPNSHLRLLPKAESRSFAVG